MKATPGREWRSRTCEHDGHMMQFLEHKDECDYCGAKRGELTGTIRSLLTTIRQEVEKEQKNKIDGLERQHLYADGWNDSNKHCLQVIDSFMI